MLESCFKFIASGVPSWLPRSSLNAAHVHVMVMAHADLPLGARSQVVGEVVVVVTLVVVTLVVVMLLGLLGGLVVVMHHFLVRCFRVVAMALRVIVEAILLVHMAEAVEGTAATLVMVGILALDVESLGTHGDLLLVLLESLLHGNLLSLLVLLLLGLLVSLGLGLGSLLLLLAGLLLSLGLGLGSLLLLLEGLLLLLEGLLLLGISLGFLLPLVVLVPNLPHPQLVAPLAQLVVALAAVDRAAQAVAVEHLDGAGLVVPAAAVVVATTPPPLVSDLTQLLGGCVVLLDLDAQHGHGHMVIGEAAVVARHGLGLAGEVPVLVELRLAGTMHMDGGEVVILHALPLKLMHVVAAWLEVDAVTSEVAVLVDGNRAGGAVAFEMAATGGADVVRAHLGEFRLVNGSGGVLGDNQHDGEGNECLHHFQDGGS